MATGYTYPIHDNKPITFEQFALSCSRAMGAAIMQRDESPEVEIRERTLDDHYVERVSKSAVALQKAIARPMSVWATLQDTAITGAEAYREKYIIERDALLGRYVEMLDRVRDWEPPTPDHHGLKRFMIEQLESSILFDCGPHTPSVPERVAVVVYRESELARLTREHERDVAHLAEERERVAGQNAWVRALRESLSTP